MKEAQSKKAHLKDLPDSNAVIRNYLNPEQISVLFNPASSLGLCGNILQRVLEAHKRPNNIIFVMFERPYLQLPQFLCCIHSF